MHQLASAVLLCWQRLVKSVVGPRQANNNFALIFNKPDSTAARTETRQQEFALLKIQTNTDAHLHVCYDRVGLRRWLLSESNAEGARRSYSDNAMR